MTHDEHEWPPVTLGTDNQLILLIELRMDNCKSASSTGGVRPGFKLPQGAEGHRAIKSPDTYTVCMQDIVSCCQSYQNTPI